VSAGFKLLHPSARLLHFLLTTSAAATSSSCTRFYKPSPACLEGNMLKPLTAQTARLFMSPQAEEYHLSNPEVAPSARSYLTELPVQLILPVAQALLAATDVPHILQVVNAGDELVASFETRHVLLVQDAKGTDSIAVCLPVDWLPSPGWQQQQQQQQCLQGQQHEHDQQQITPRTCSSAGTWVMVDPSGAFEDVFVGLNLGEVLCAYHD
jgi:hypothetical protein